MPATQTLMLGKSEAKRRKGWQRMRWLDSTTDSTNMNLNKRRRRARKHGVLQSTGVTKSWTRLSEQHHLLIYSLLQEKTKKLNGSVNSYSPTLARFLMLRTLPGFPNKFLLPFSVVFIKFLDTSSITSQN